MRRVDNKDILKCWNKYNQQKCRADISYKGREEATKTLTIRDANLQHDVDKYTIELSSMAGTTKSIQIERTATVRELVRSLDEHDYIYLVNTHDYVADPVYDGDRKLKDFLETRSL